MHLCFGNDNGTFFSNSNTEVVKSREFKVKLPLTLGKLFIYFFKKSSHSQKAQRRKCEHPVAHHSEAK